MSDETVNNVVQQSMDQTMYVIFLTTAAGPPTGLATEVVGNTSIHVFWNAPISRAAVKGYRISFQTKGNKGRYAEI